jgi:protein-tyrosine phosphatase
MMKYSEQIIQSHCASLIGSSSLDAISILGEKMKPFVSTDDARDFQQLAWGKSDGKKRQAVYLGGLCASTDEAVLKANKITHIVNLCDKCPNKFPQLEYLTLLVPSEEDGYPDYPAYMIYENIDSILQFIEGALQKGENVLIHSTRGASRSFFVATAYLMKTHGWTIDQASTHIMSIRTSVEPSDAVLKYLVAFAASLSQDASH